MPNSSAALETVMPTTRPVGTVACVASQPPNANIRQAITSGGNRPRRVPRRSAATGPSNAQTEPMAKACP